MKLTLEVGQGGDGNKQDEYNVCQMVVSTKEKIIKQQSAKLMSGVVILDKGGQGGPCCKGDG